MKSEIHGMFPFPAYIIKRDSIISPEEEKECTKIIEGGMTRNIGNSISVNSHIFNGNLKNIKQFCEEHIKLYVEQVINPKEELDFYITQSWLNVTKPGENHHEHYHANSIISGVFYVSTEEADNIMFTDPNYKIKSLLKLEPKGLNMWNSSNVDFPVENNSLVLFPSWLNHQVKPNEKATRDRISLSFNTFVKGNLGREQDLTKLILK